MIRPEKYMQLEQCTLNVAATVLGEIRQVLVAPPSQLEGLVASKLGDSALANFQNAVNILYLLGLVEYDEQADAFLFLEGPSRGAA
jgi:hypothetical protein